MGYHDLSRALQELHREQKARELWLIGKRFNQEAKMSVFGVFFTDDEKLENPIFKSPFMSVAEAYCLINENAYEWVGRKLMVKPMEQEEKKDE